MKKYVFFLVFLISFLQSCERSKGGWGADCDGYDKGVAAMNLQSIKIDDYNSIKTVFYRLGHWKSCEYNGNFKMPLSEQDTLMVSGYVTDTLRSENFPYLIYKVTDSSIPSDHVPFVFFAISENMDENELDSIARIVYNKITINKGKRIYVKDIFVMQGMSILGNKFPYEIIPGKGFGNSGPDFVIPLIIIRNEESIHFE